MRNGILNEYEEILRRNGLRSTKQKQMVFELLLKSDRPMSAQDIASSLSGINVSTVYRVLEALVKVRVAKIVPRGFKTLYEVGDMFCRHHHHVTCERCGKTVVVHSERMEWLIRELTVKAGMMPTLHHVEMYGLCGECDKMKLNKT